MFLLLTKGITISHLCPPTANKMDLVLLEARHLGVPRAHELHVLLDLVGLDLVEDDAVRVLAAREHLAEAALHVLVERAPLGGAVHDVLERRRHLAGLLRLLLALGLECFSC